MENLKPCPFCGGEAFYFPDFRNPASWKISCRKDCSTIPARPDIWFTDLQIAIEKWNTRSQPTPIDWETGETTTDGNFLCYIERKEECGAIWKYFDVVKNTINTWMLKDGEKVIAWTYLPPPPNITTKCKHCKRKPIDETNKHNLCKNCYGDLIAFGTLPNLSANENIKE
jgi:hypothetical protein